MSFALEVLFSLVGALLGSRLGRGRMTTHAAKKRQAKFELGYWFMIPVALVEGVDQGGKPDSPNAKVRRRTFEIRVNAASKGGVHLGWWDAGRLGALPDLIERGRRRNAGDSLVAIEAASGDLIEIHTLDLVILEQVIREQ